MEKLNWVRRTDNKKAGKEQMFSGSVMDDCGRCKDFLKALVWFELQVCLQELVFSPTQCLSVTSKSFLSLLCIGTFDKFPLPGKGEDMK